MGKFLYNRDKQEIFLYDSLMAHRLNSTAAFIFENYLDNSPIDVIASRMVDIFDVSREIALDDIKEFLSFLDELGIKGNGGYENEKNLFLEIGKTFHLHTPILHIIQNCNSPCKMCDCWKTKGKVWHTASDLKPLFLKIKELGAVSVMISGGEPLLHPELKQIINDLNQLNIKVMLNTNALLLHKHMDLAVKEIDALVVSMDGYNPNTYQTFRGLNGYQIVWKNLELFQKKSPKTKIGIRTIFNKYNYDKMDVLFGEIESRGMHSVGVSPADVSSKSFSRFDISSKRELSLIELLIPSKEQIIEFLESFNLNSSYYNIIDKAYEKQLSSWSPHDFIRCMQFYLNIREGNLKMFTNEPCIFPKSSFVLDYDGDLINCFYSKPFGNLYDFSQTDWSFVDAMTDLEKTRKCESCRGKVFCGTESPNFHHRDIHAIH